MAIFARKTGLELAEWSAIQDKIERLQFQRIPPPHDLMMLFIETSKVTPRRDIFIVLPDTVPLSDFLGFVEINREDLPNSVSALIVREDGFDEMFPDIAVKRKRKSEGHE